MMPRSSTRIFTRAGSLRPRKNTCPMPAVCNWATAIRNRVSPRQTWSWSGNTRLRTIHQGYIESHVTTVTWDSNDYVTVWTATQGQFALRDHLADIIRCRSATSMLCRWRLAAVSAARSVSISIRWRPFSRKNHNVRSRSPCAVTRCSVRPDRVRHLYQAEVRRQNGTVHSRQPTCIWLRGRRLCRGPPVPRRHVRHVALQHTQYPYRWLRRHRQQATMRPYRPRARPRPCSQWNR